MTNDTITVLDHGYVRYIEHYGSDERIIEAARMSTAKGFQGWGTRCKNCGDHADNPLLLRDCPAVNATAMEEAVPHVFVSGDEKLLKYLYTNQHNTPFEFAGAVFEIQAPIFVFREWHRHRTQSYNEMSARYTPLPNVNYFPTVERLTMGGGSNKQAQSTGAALSAYAADLFLGRLRNAYLECQQLYENALDNGVPKELARIILPVGRYSRMRASANLRNWLAFITLRCDEHAQFEIRQFANAVATHIRELFPRTYDLWDSYKLTLVPKEAGF